jgi:hypothetical protein
MMVKNTWWKINELKHNLYSTVLAVKKLMLFNKIFARHHPYNCLLNANHPPSIVAILN